MGILSRLYLAWAFVVVAVCGYAWERGFAPASGKRGLIPQNVRQAPGGYRAYTFWQGGK